MWDDRRDCTHHPEDSACYDEADGVLRNSPGWLALGFQLIPAPSLIPFSWIVSKSRAPRATSISARIVRTSRSSSACGPPTCDRECVASLRSDLPPTSLSSLKIAVSARAAGSLPPGHLDSEHHGSRMRSIPSHALSIPRHLHETYSKDQRADDHQLVQGRVHPPQARFKAACTLLARP